MQIQLKSKRSKKYKPTKKFKKVIKGYNPEIDIKSTLELALERKEREWNDDEYDAGKDW